jgi:hypothetical protein
MTDPLDITEERHVAAKPEWDAMVALSARVAEINEPVIEWRMHPAAYHEFLNGIPVPVGDFTFSYAREVLGAPLIIDQTLEEGTCRATIYRWTTRIGDRND